MLREFSHRGAGEYRPSTMIYDAIVSFAAPAEEQIPPLIQGGES